MVRAAVTYRETTRRVEFAVVSDCCRTGNQIRSHLSGIQIVKYILYYILLVPYDIRRSH
ncbi:unnamed protein product [Brugia timori]|uniref:Uncharacterized protein n=1 Tax=Brugia timori TaxID=42155 RepID=A0A0R3R5C3_9BILA|nr:unnamed protein product [Brugia timori]